MDEYKVVGTFLSPSKISGEMVKMVVVCDDRGACIMPENEWKWVYGRQHRKDGKGMIQLRSNKLIRKIRSKNGEAETLYTEYGEYGGIFCL